MDDLNAMRVVLPIIDPDYPQIYTEEITKNRNLLKSAIKLSERNGLYYNFISKLREMDVELPPSEKERWHKEEQRLAEFKETIRLLNKVSDDYGIDYILIKICNIVPYIPKDVDIFIGKEDRIRLINALENNGMKCIHSSTAETILRKTGYIDIEFYTGINYLGVNFIDEDFLWKSKTKDKMFDIEFPGLNKESSFLLTLIHRLIAHRSISLLDLLYLMSLIKGIQDISVCRKYTYEKGWGAVFDLAQQELNTIHEKIYQEGKIINFPYLFDRKFVLRCVSEVDGLKIKGYSKMFLQLSLIQDGILHRLNNSALYNLLKSFKLTRNAANALFRVIKSGRGDR